MKKRNPEDRIQETEEKLLFNFPFTYKKMQFSYAKLIQTH